MHTRYFLFVCLTFLGLFSGCVQEAELPEYQDVQISINAKVDNEGIDLSGDLQTEGQQVIERGFILQRTYYNDGRWNSKTLTDTFKLTDYTTPFSYRETDYMADEASCEAYAYAKLDRGIYRSSPVSFSAGGKVQAEVFSVEIRPTDNIGAQGTVIIKGKNFSRILYRNELEIDTSWITPAYGHCTLREKEANSTYLIYDYLCCQVGETPLRFTSKDVSIRLNERIKVNGVSSWKLIPSSPRRGEVVQVVMDNIIENAQYKLDLFSGYGFYPINENKVIFTSNLPERSNVLLSCDFNGFWLYSNFMPVTFSCPWKYVGRVPTSTYSIYAKDKWIYSCDRRNIYAHSIAGEETQTWQIVYPDDVDLNDPEGEGIPNGDALYANGNDIYVCEPAVGKTENGKKALQTFLLHFRQIEEQWETIACFPYASYIKISQCGNKLLITLDNKDLAVCDLNNGSCTIHSNVLNGKFLLGDTYKDSFYYLNKKDDLYWQCYRINIDGSGTAQPIGQRLASSYEDIFYYGNLQIEGDYLYISHPLARLPLNKNNAAWEYLGAPAGWDNITKIAPTPTSIFCVGSNLYRFEDDRK